MDKRTEELLDVLCHVETQYYNSLCDVAESGHRAFESLLTKRRRADSLLIQIVERLATVEQRQRLADVVGEKQAF